MDNLRSLKWKFNFFSSDTYILCQVNILFLAKTSEEKVGQDEVLEQVDVRLWPDPGEEREEGGQHQQGPWGHHCQATGDT